MLCPSAQVRCESSEHSLTAHRRQVKIQLCSGRASHCQPWSNLQGEACSSKSNSSIANYVRWFTLTRQKHSEQMMPTSDLLPGICKSILPARSSIAFVMLSLLTILTRSVDSVSLHIMHHMFCLSLGSALPYIHHHCCLNHPREANGTLRSPSMHRCTPQCHTPCTDCPDHLYPLPKNHAGF